MVQFLYVDEDGDFVPVSVKKSLYAAECWDLWKTEKYKGIQKAPSVVLQYWSRL